MIPGGRREGQQLGQYQLIRLLGTGGFADVYLGEHLYLKSQAAIKVLRTALAEEDIDAFLAEARRLVALRHPHIIRVLDFAVERSVPFLVMEYAPSGTLRTRHPKGSCVQLELIVTYVKQIADALDYTHAKKLVHRDVKPENMLLRANDEIVLSDFGIAAVSHTTGSLLLEGQAGTPAYMAPEQVRKMPRPASDQYALGIVVYEWLCGSRPFNGPPMSIAYQHLKAALPPLHERIPDIPPELEAVVGKALDKDPQQRFADVRTFAAALEQIVLQMKTTPVLPPHQDLSSTTTVPFSLGTTPETELPHAVLFPDQPSVPKLPVASAQSVAPDISGSTVSIPDRSLLGIVAPAPPPSSLLDMPAAAATASPSSLARRPSKRGVSRRSMAIGLGLTVAGGGLAWLLSSRTIQPLRPPGPTPTSAPLGTLLYTYRGHTNSVSAVAWSPNGKRIASASIDRTVQVWDAIDGSHVFTYRGHAADVWAVAWSPDGKRIVSASYDSVIQVWDATNGSHVFTYHGHTDALSSVAWSPDGKRIASAGRDRTVQVWDATDGSLVFIYRGHTDWIHEVTWSPNSKRIASGSDDTTVQVWNAIDGGHALKYQGPAGIDTVAWSPDGKHIASGSDGGPILSESDYTTAQVWDATTGTLTLAYRGHTGPVVAVVWAPDSQRMASTSWDKTVQVWDAMRGTHIFTYNGHVQAQYTSVFALAWSPDGKRIASGGTDQVVQVWQAV